MLSKTVPAVPKNVINNVLKMYIENGIQELPIIEDKSKKLSNVGF